MKTFPKLALALLAAHVLITPAGFAAAPSEQDALAVARSVVKADRQTAVAECMQLSEAEAPKFWPLYHQYRVEVDQVADRLLKLVQEYARYYPNVPEGPAKKMLKELTGLEQKQLAIRTAYLKKFGKILPAAKTLRFAQVENRLDLALRLELAAQIPLVPIEGKLTFEQAGAGVYAKGVPGGVLVQTYELTATVAAIDPASRKVTLLNAEGIKQTVKAGPEVINFDQIRVGDRLKITATEELVVQMAKPGQSPEDGANAVVALAPKGAKPGGLMAETVQVTATVRKIDAARRKVTLEFQDGSTKTLPVRKDVDLTQHKAGEKVMLRSTETLAILVVKP